MDAKRWICLVLLTSLLAGCGQAVATPTPVPPLLKQPWAVFVDSEGRIYVTDEGNDCLVRFDDASGARWVAYGSQGSGVGQFRDPYDVFVDMAGKIYVADLGNYRVVRMDDMNGSNWIALGASWTGTGGSGEGEFSGPARIAVAPDGKIYVADHSNHRVVRVDDMNGANWTVYGSEGTGIGQFLHPWGVALDAEGRIYVADWGNGRVVRIDDMTGRNWVSFAPRGGVDMCVDPAGRVYLTDPANLRDIRTEAPDRILRYDDMSGSNWTACPAEGSGRSEFNGPAGVFVDSAGRIYVTDVYNRRIVRMDDMSGTNWTTFP